MMCEHLSVIFSSSFEVEYDNLLNPDCITRLALASRTGRGDRVRTNKLFGRDLQTGSSRVNLRNEEEGDSSNSQYHFVKAGRAS